MDSKQTIIVSSKFEHRTSYDRSTGTWSTHRYYHCDGMGNVMAMIDVDGNVTAAYQYDPYGWLRRYTGSEADDNPFRFSTKLWLDFGPDYYGNAGVYNMSYGLYYYGYRYYAPQLQRWLSRDPLEATHHLYLFVAQNPLNTFDPDGQDIWIIRKRGIYGHRIVVGENPDGTFWAAEKFPAFQDKCKPSSCDSCDSIKAVACKSLCIFHSKFAITFHPQYRMITTHTNYQVEAYLSTIPEVDKKVRDMAEQKCHTDRIYSIAGGNCITFAQSIFDYAVLMDQMYRLRDRERYLREKAKKLGIQPWWYKSKRIPRIK